MYRLYQGDCLEVMKEIPDKSIDLVLTDPPYGTTECKWDTVIDLDLMWSQLKRVIKPKGAIVLFGSEPFSSHLRMSNIKEYKYDWYWVKSKSTGFIHCKNKPLKNIELISIFSSGSTVHKSQSKSRMAYNPQGLIKSGEIKSSAHKFGSMTGSRPSHKETYTREFSNYPKMVLDFKVGVNTVHPTQKPVPLMEYMIRTYTNQGETVLDFTMGSGTTGVAARRLARYFIGIELDPGYFEIAKERIENA